MFQIVLCHFEWFLCFFVQILGFFAHLFARGRTFSPTFCVWAFRTFWGFSSCFGPLCYFAGIYLPFCVLVYYSLGQVHLKKNNFSPPMFILFFRLFTWLLLPAHTAAHHDVKLTKRLILHIYLFFFSAFFFLLVTSRRRRAPSSRPGKTGKLGESVIWNSPQR